MRKSMDWNSCNTLNSECRIFRGATWLSTSVLCSIKVKYSNSNFDVTASMPYHVFFCWGAFCFKIVWKHERSHTHTHIYILSYSLTFCLSQTHYDRNVEQSVQRAPVSYTSAVVIVSSHKFSQKKNAKRRKQHHAIKEQKNGVYVNEN